MTTPVIAVTGGTLGIGRRAVDLLAADGVGIGVCARSNAPVVAAEVSTTHGVATFGMDADVTDPDALERFATLVADELGSPTGLLCCAGVLGPIGSIDETEPGEWAAAVAVNLVGVANAVRAFVPHLASGASIVALSGVVVNDSLVMVDAANRKRREVGDPFQAILWAGVRRFRPIILTSLTTFFGLAPMIFESSMQARFLVPMAISIGFGVLFATFIILLLVPALYLIVEDCRRGWRLLFADPPP